MIQHAPHCINIMCSESTPGSQLAREVAIIIRDGLLVWCRVCQCSHHVHKDVCTDVWNGSQGIASSRITCDAISARNAFGRDKLYVIVDLDGVTHWCKYCKKEHRIKMEKCLELWGSSG